MARVSGDGTSPSSHHAPHFVLERLGRPLRGFRTYGRFVTTVWHAIAAAFVLVACQTAVPATAVPTGPTPSPSPSPTASPSPSPSPKPTPSPPPAVSEACANELADMLDALEELDGRLDVGLNFRDYSERVGDISVAANRLNADRLSAEGAICLEAAIHLNGAFVEYAAAYDTWNACIDRTGCDTDSIRSELQTHWSKASHEVAEGRKFFP